jgi:hypothetical protein
MIRPLLALAGIALIAGPAAAATYSATPTIPASGKFAARDILWACGSGTCVGSTENSRPLVLCQGLAKQAGRLESFTVNGQAIEASQLDKCNAAARTGKTSALAAQ